MTCYFVGFKVWCFEVNTTGQVIFCSVLRTVSVSSTYVFCYSVLACILLSSRNNLELYVCSRQKQIRSASLRFFANKHREWHRRTKVSHIACSRFSRYSNGTVELHLAICLLPSFFTSLLIHWFVCICWQPPLFQHSQHTDISHAWALFTAFRVCCSQFVTFIDPPWSRTP